MRLADIVAVDIRIGSITLLIPQLPMQTELWAAGSTARRATGPSLAALLIFSLAAALVAPREARAQVDWDHRVHVESDARLTLPGKEPFDGPDFERIENIVRASLVGATEDVEVLFDLSVINARRADTLPFDGLFDRSQVDPLRFESEAMYVTLLDFLVGGLDVRVGRQNLQWGTADRFNPTNNINPYDFEDPIAFGQTVANEMLVASFTAPWSVYGDSLTIFDELTLQLVAVPIHRAGTLPRSSTAALTDPDLFAKLVHNDDIKAMAGLQRVFTERGGEFVYDIGVDSPEQKLENAQLAARLSMTLLGVDVSGSYYSGYGMARPTLLNAVLPDTPLFNALPLDDLGTLVEAVEGMDGLDLTGTSIPTLVRLTYPRIQVIGADMATSLDFLGGLGLWAEYALTLHDELAIELVAGQQSSTNIESKASSFSKVTAGMDYSITAWWYMNVQYVHGFVDEFGSWALQDYVIAGSDFKMFREQMLLRLFGIYNLDDKSYVAYPEVQLAFWQRVRLSVAAYIPGGDRLSKFGNLATGHTTLVMKGRYGF